MSDAVVVLRDFALDTDEDGYWRPLCCEEGCKVPAVRIVGHYENSDSMQGEHAKFGGWFFCQRHAVAFFQRRKRERVCEEREQALIEALADKEHASWARWMEYFLGNCKRQPDGALVIAAEYVGKLEQQMCTPYAELSEREKQYDRDEVAHILPIIREYAAMTLTARDATAFIEALSTPVPTPPKLAEAAERYKALMTETDDDDDARDEKTPQK